DDSGQGLDVFVAPQRWHDRRRDEDRLHALIAPKQRSGAFRPPMRGLEGRDFPAIRAEAQQYPLDTRGVPEQRAAGLRPRMSWLMRRDWPAELLPEIERRLRALVRSDQPGRRPA